MILVYIIKWAIALTILYSLYGLLLRKETHYRANRAVLVGIMLTSAILPLVRFTVDNEAAVHKTVSVISDQLTISPAADAANEQLSKTSHLPLILLIVYAVGVLAFAIRYLTIAAKVLRIIHDSKKEDGYYVNDSVACPFSWFNCIVISSADLRANGKALLAHERAHVENLHSYDLLLCEITTTLQWWNPFAWMLRNDLCSVHEYEADYIVTHQEGINDFDYKMLLIHKATETNAPSIVNAINHTSLKERLKQMYRKPSTKAALLKVLYVLPLSAFVMFCYARPKVAERMEQAIVHEEAALMEKVVASVLPTPIASHIEEAIAEAPAPMQAEDEVVVDEKDIAEKDEHDPQVVSDDKPCIYDAPLNTNSSIYYKGFYVKKLDNETHVMCVGTCESDDELVTLGGNDAYIEDTMTRKRYKPTGALNKSCWGTFHICNMKGKTFVLTLVFPPLPDDVEFVRMNNLCSWINSNEIYQLDYISEK